MGEPIYDAPILCSMGGVKSESPLVEGLVKSGGRWMKEEGRRLDKRLVWPELVTNWIQ